MKGIVNFKSLKVDMKDLVFKIQDSNYNKLFA